jgi:hypothetical protein
LSGVKEISLKDGEYVAELVWFTVDGCGEIECGVVCGVFDEN